MTLGFRMVLLLPTSMDSTAQLELFDISPTYRFVTVMIMLLRLGKYILLCLAHEPALATPALATLHLPPLIVVPGYPCDPIY